MHICISPTQSDSYTQLPFYDDFEVFDKFYGDVDSTNFGRSVSIDGTTTLIGSYSSVSVSNCTAYFYEWDGTNWIKDVRINAPAGAGRFGYAVAVYGDRAVIGATTADNKGAAYVYERTGTNWNYKAKLTASDAASGDVFGCAVALNDNTVLVGAYGNNYSKGSAYVFTGSGTNCSESTNMYGTSYSRMGRAVAISDSHIVVGAPSTPSR